MTEPNVEQSGTKANPLVNLDGWLSENTPKRDAEPASSTGQGNTQASPAQPTVAESPAAVQPTSWRDTPIGDDVEHGFFKGKKAGDLYQSYQYSERAKQEAETERNRLRAELDGLRRQQEAELAARRVQAEQQRQQPSQPEDPLDRAEQLIFENPREAMRIVKEQALLEARQIAVQEASQAQERIKQEWATREVANRGESAFAIAKSKLGVGEDEFSVDANTRGGMRGMAVYSAITRPGTGYYAAGGPLNPEVIVQAYKDLFGEPQPIATVAQAPALQLQTPPGANRPAKATMPASQASPITDEQRRLYEAMAEIGKVPVDAYIKRQGAKRG